MFFDVTRMGGRRTLRLRAEAIAWLEESEGVTAIHLIGGETIRVNEARDEIEARCLPSQPPEPEPATADAEILAEPLNALSCAGVPLERYMPGRSHANRRDQQARKTA